MTCLRNKIHNKEGTVCKDCLKEINTPFSKPDIASLSPDLRALFLQLTTQHEDINQCWQSPFTHVNVNGKRLHIENVLYGFYKADIGNYKLKRTCGTIGCINPSHHRSRFEVTDISKYVRTGFNRRMTLVTELSDPIWLQQP